MAGRDDDEIDREVSDIIEVETNRGRGKGPIDPQRRRRAKLLASELIRAKDTKNERGFSDALRRGGIREGSQFWKNAWKFFWS
jgi:hypothetical protein